MTNILNWRWLTVALILGMFIGIISSISWFIKTSKKEVLFYRKPIFLSFTYESIFETYIQKYKDQSSIEVLVHENNSIKATLRTLSSVSYVSVMGSLIALLNVSGGVKAAVVGISFFVFFDSLFVVYFLNVAKDAITRLINDRSEDTKK